MNVVREINKINEKELDLGTTGSWHDDYKDSAYIFIGGLHPDLTEGDVITIFSQFGEVMDVNLPRDKNTGKTKGFGFLMYEDQRSTVLAVDNLNGAKILERTLRVDHVKNYKQPRVKNEEGELVDREEQSLNAKPELVIHEEEAVSEDSESDSADIDPEDPMRDFLIAQRKEEKAKKKSKSKKKGKHKDETPEERRARKERKKTKMKRSDGVKGIEELLDELEGRRRHRSREHGRSPGRRRSTTPERRREREEDERDTRWDRRERRDRSPSRTPPRGPGNSYRPRSTSPSRMSRRPEGRDESSSYGRNSDRVPARRGPRT